MRRQVIVAAAGAAAGLVVIGLVVVGAQRGVLDGLIGGSARRLLAQAGAAERRGQLPQAQAVLEELIGMYPDSPWTDDALLKLARVHAGQRHLAEARDTYRMLLAQFPDSPLSAKAQEELGEVNVALLLSPNVTDGDVAYVVKPGDALGRIASRHGTTVEFLKTANGLTSDLIRPGQRLKVPTGRFSIVVDKSDNQLLLTEGDEFVKSYDVATGKDNSTPVGTFKIVNRIPNPVWYKQGAVVPPESPENILGTRWLGFDKPGYGIHGSTDPGTIGQQVTAGCVRMRNEDVEELFAIVPIGTDVTIVD